MFFKWVDMVYGWLSAAGSYTIWPSGLDMHVVSSRQMTIESEFNNMENPGDFLYM